VTTPLNVATETKKKQVRQFGGQNDSLLANSGSLNPSPEMLLTKGSVEEHKRNSPLAPLEDARFRGMTPP
jgi:hypothetical protein